VTTPGPELGDDEASTRRAGRARPAAHGHAHLHVHGHGHGHGDVAVDERWAKALWPIVIGCAVLTALAVGLLWPGGSDGFDDPLGFDADPIDAEVVAVDLVACSFSPADRCALAGFELSGGIYDGEFGAIEETAPGRLEVGEKIRVTFFDDVDGNRIFSLYDYQRDSPMLLLLALFVGAVLALGRWRGLGAMAGLVASLFVIVGFTLPAVLDGSNAVVVAVVSASVIAFLALFLAHGFDHATAVALVSTLLSLLLTAVLAWLFVGATNLTGLTDDSSFLLSGLREGIDPRGILLAGIVIGSLGVLDDVTVTQVSAVWQLKAVQPELGITELMKPALRIGRDHISSTVNTLFLAYAGTSLPLLLLFVEANQGFGDVITRELVATEVVRTLVGSIGLVASVPISTWLAAMVVTGGAPALAEDAAEQAG
jgi:uncharacterized membrane protein